MSKTNMENFIKAALVIFDVCIKDTGAEYSSAMARRNQYQTNISQHKAILEEQDSKTKKGFFLQWLSVPLGGPSEKDTRRLSPFQ